MIVAFRKTEIGGQRNDGRKGRALAYPIDEEDDDRATTAGAALGLTGKICDPDFHCVNFGICFVIFLLVHGETPFK